MTVEQHAGPVVVSQPLYGATLRQAVVRFWRKYGVFSGRASRSEYWWWYLVSTVVSLVLTGIDIAVVGYRPYVPPPGIGLWDLLVHSLVRSVRTSVASWSWAAVTFIGQLAVTVRRLHDTNRSGWWYLFILLPIAGPIALIVILAEAPTATGQRFDR